MRDWVDAFCRARRVTVGDAPAGSFVRMRVFDDGRALIMDWKAVDSSPVLLLHEAIRQAFETHGAKWVEGTDACVFGPRGAPAQRAAAVWLLTTGCTWCEANVARAPPRDSIATTRLGAPVPDLSTSASVRQFRGGDSISRWMTRFRAEDAREFEAFARSTPVERWLSRVAPRLDWSVAAPLDAPRPRTQQ
jgi:hypothetical protein